MSVRILESRQIWEVEYNKKAYRVVREFRDDGYYCDVFDALTGVAIDADGPEGRNIVGSLWLADNLTWMKMEDK